MKKQAERTDSGNGMAAIALESKRDGLSHDRQSAGPASIPWQQRPAGSEEIVWRHLGNPVIGRNFVPGAQGI